MAKNQSPEKPGKPKRRKPKPVTGDSEPEKVKIGPLDPPRPEYGGGAPAGGKPKAT